MLLDEIRSQLKDAMRAKEEPRLTVLRGLLSAFTGELTATGRTPQDTLSDEEALGVIRREVKRRRDAAEQFRAGGRDELAQGEEAELAVLESFLPQMMSREEIAPVVAAKQEELGITEKKDMGRLMGAVMGELKGKADGGDVKAEVERTLSS